MHELFHTRHDFPDADTLANALASGVAEDLQALIDRHGQAVVAVSGGSTPKLFFRQLGKSDLNWHKVVITLVDERWVPASHPRSNEKLIREFLMPGKAANAHFVGLYSDATSPDCGLTEIAKSLPPKLDIAILGMGTDGHTASFFPGGDNLERATDRNNPQTVISMQAKGAGEARITRTLSALLQASRLYLHIEGPEKAEVLRQAFQTGTVHDAPIRCLLHQTSRPLDIFWAP